MCFFKGFFVSPPNCFSYPGRRKQKQRQRQRRQQCQPPPWPIDHDINQNQFESYILWLQFLILTMFFSMRVAMCFANFIAPKHVVSCLFDINLYVTYCKLSLRTTSVCIVNAFPQIAALVQLQKVWRGRGSNCTKLSRGYLEPCWSDDDVKTPAAMPRGLTSVCACTDPVLPCALNSMDAKCKSLPMSRADRELSYKEPRNAFCLETGWL